jgi:hypothetical protein
VEALVAHEMNDPCTVSFDHQAYNPIPLIHRKQWFNAQRKSDDVE